MKYSGLSVLVVEDDPSWQQVLVDILADLGLSVDVTDDVDSAIDIIRSEPHRLAVVDLSLDKANHRNQDGFTVLDALHRHDPGCEAVLLSGYATVEIAVSALTEHRALTCIRKERFVRSEFRDLVHQALASPSPWIGSQPEPSERSPDDVLSPSPLPSAAEEPGGLALVIEDDAGWRSLLAELLDESGYEVRICASYGDALGHLGRERYDLAVVDLSLSQRSVSGAPDDRNLDGYRLLSSARASGIPTIVVSGIASPDAVEHIYEEYGIFSFLEKQTFDRSAFLQTIQEVGGFDAGDGELDVLTDRELQVLTLLVTGMSNQEIANTLVISTNTVKRHLKMIYQKLDIHNRAAAVAKAINAGLTTG